MQTVSQGDVFQENEKKKQKKKNFRMSSAGKMSLAR